ASAAAGRVRRTTRDRSMTKLLISVRSAMEAEVALAGGADVIDVKEPSRGALGAADSRVWRAVRKVIGSRAVLSVALGELLDDAIFDNAEDAAGFSFAKIGLAGCRDRRGWLKRWLTMTEALAARVRAVPVA